MPSRRPARPASLLPLIASLALLGWHLLGPTDVAAQQVVESRVVATEKMEMELVAERPGIRPGEEFWLALRMRMPPGWYTYWRFAGDAGDGAVIDWRLPEGFSADGITWPYPQLKLMSPAAVYIYEGEAFLLTRLVAPPDLVPGTTVEISAHVDYFVCEDGCYPEELEPSIRLPVIAELPPPDPRWAAAFHETWAKVPVRPDGWTLTAGWQNDRLLLRAEPPAGVVPDAEGVVFFAGIPDLIDHPTPQRVTWRNGVLLLDMQGSHYALEPAERAAGVLVVPLQGDDGTPTGIEIDVEILSSAEFAAAGAVGGAGRGVPTTLWFALLLAFGGGLLLNLMPCVFPVVSLKVLGFVRLAGERPAEVRRHGLSFAAGVIVAFWALAGLLIVLRLVGEEIGWGFQLQTPGFIAFMAFLLFGIGLNLAGVFEIGTSLGRLGAGSPAASGYTGSAANGVLATVVATPCTAPFMGAALGFALTLSAAGALLVFTALAVGMAAPYVVLSMAPALLRYLPKPGAWMETFKQALSFPLFATTAWLVWVFGHQTGVDGVLRLLLGLTLLAMAAWCWGRWGSVLTAARASRLVGRGAAAAFLLVGFGLAMGASPLPAGAGLSAAAGAAGENDGARIQWETFSAEAVAGHREAGRAVFIDFTAAWCLTCKVNERISLDVPEVVALVEELNIVMLKADWTTRDPAITRALAGFGRSGVPLYVVYSPDPFAPPRLLPEVLTPALVIRALQQAGS